MVNARFKRQYWMGSDLDALMWTYRSACVQPMHYSQSLLDVSETLRFLQDASGPPKQWPIVGPCWFIVQNGTSDLFVACPVLPPIV